MTMRWTLATALLSSGCIIGPGVIGETATDAATDGDGDSSGATDHDGMSASSAADSGDGGDTTDGDPTDGSCTGACAGVTVQCRSSPGWTGAIDIERTPDDGLVLGLGAQPTGSKLIHIGDDGDDQMMTLGTSNGSLLAFSIGSSGDIAVLYSARNEQSLDGYVVERRSALGVPLWSKRVAVNEGNLDGPFIEGHDIAIGDDDEIYVAAVYYGDRVPPIVPFDERVDAYDADGNERWIWSEHGTGLAVGRLVDPVGANEALAWFTNVDPESPSEDIGYHMRRVLGGETETTYTFHDASAVDGLIGPLSHSSSGWHGVRSIEGGLAVSHFDESFELLSVNYDVPPTQRPTAKGATAHGDGALVLLEFDDPSLGTVLRSYDPDGIERWTVSALPLAGAYGIDAVQLSDGTTVMLGDQYSAETDTLSSFICSVAS